MKELSKTLWLIMFIACTAGVGFFYMLGAWLVVMGIMYIPKYVRERRKMRDDWKNYYNEHPEEFFHIHGYYPWEKPSKRTKK
ncbi:MAG: hypothetical protein J6Y84_04555 [Bacteroidaceae bacterium]|nr:hypothetical protein [Bacteroidaceae bacterium]